MKRASVIRIAVLLAAFGPSAYFASGIASAGNVLHVRSATVAGHAPLHSIALGESWGCAIRSNLTVACWGNNASGEAPTNCATNTAAACFGHFIQLTAGAEATCGIRTDTTVSCWGDNSFGVAPSDCASNSTLGCYGTFVQITVRSYHACGIHTDGTVTCWGYNGNGEAPSDCLTNSGEACHGTFTQIASADYSTCAVRTDQTVACWGANGYGVAPTDCATNTSDSCYGHFMRLSGEYYSMCGIKTDLTVDCWGDNFEGQAPTDCATNTNDACHDSFVVVATGSYSSCGLTVAHAVKCWGQSGDINDCVKALPDCVGTFRQLAAASGAFCGIRSNRTISCWGNSSSVVTDCATNAADACHGQFGPLGSNLTFSSNDKLFTGLTEAPPGVNGISLRFQYHTSPVCKKGVSSPMVSLAWTKLGSSAGSASAICSIKTKKFANALLLSWNDSGVITSAIWKAGQRVLGAAAGISASPDGALINLCPYKSTVCKSSKSTTLTGLSWTKNGSVSATVAVKKGVHQIEFAGTPST